MFVGFYLRTSISIRRAEGAYHSVLGFPSHIEEYVECSHDSSSATTFSVRACTFEESLDSLIPRRVRDRFRPILHRFSTSWGQGCEYFQHFPLLMALESTRPSFFSMVSNLDGPNAFVRKSTSCSSVRTYLKLNFLRLTHLRIKWWAL